MAATGPNSPDTPKTVPIAGGRLDSWKEIARYLNREVRTVQRWEATSGLPVYRLAEGRLKGSPVYAFKSELDAWLRRNPPPPTEREAEPKPGIKAGWKFRRMFWVAAAVLVAVAGGAIVWYWLGPKRAAPPLRVVRLTSYRGTEQDPAVSPDGKQIAFSWNGAMQDNFDLYVRLLDGGEPLRLTTHPGVDGWPAWSPDGRMIAFARWLRGAATVDLLIVPALGGAERKLAEFKIPPQPSNYWPAVCWTPDGTWIIGPHAAVSKAPAALAVTSVETLQIRPLTRPVAGSIGDCCPALAPDGRRLAFLRALSGRMYNLYVLALSPDYQPLGEPRELTHEVSRVVNPMWTGDGQELLYITSGEGIRTLWRIRSDGSRPASPVQSLGPIGTSYAISARGDRLVYSDHTWDSAIWSVDLPGGTHLSRILTSSAVDFNPQIAPDGNRIAFVSNRARGRRVWVSGVDGANPMDLARAAELFTGPARWSPDDNWIVFECQNEGNDDVCIVPAGGGAVRRLTRHAARDTLPSWSRDGKWIYFTSNRSGSYQVWKALAAGTDTAPPVQVTQGGGFGAVESVDGATLYFSRGRTSGAIWRIATGGGEESRVGDFRILGRSQNFAVGAEGIYYGSSGDPERWFELCLYRFATGKSESICRIGKRLESGISVFPDGRRLLFASPEAEFGDLYMVENFR